MAKEGGANMGVFYRQTHTSITQQGYMGHAVGRV